MPRDERELSLHWRTEASKAFRILNQLRQQPVPNWNGALTQRKIREAAHLCQETVALLGSDPDLVEGYAEELYRENMDDRVSWDKVPLKIRSVYCERARQELQSMAPPPIHKAENVLIQSESAAQQAAGTSVKEVVENYYKGMGIDLAVDAVVQTGPFQYEVRVAPVRAEQHEQQEEYPHNAPRNVFTGGGLGDPPVGMHREDDLPWTEEEKSLARQLHDKEYPDQDFDRLKPKPKEKYLREARLALRRPGQETE